MQLFTKIFESVIATLIILNKEMDDIMKIIKSLEESGLFVKVLAKQLKMKRKNKGVDFLPCY